MFLYNLTLQRATGISYAIHGNFSGNFFYPVTFFGLGSFRQQRKKGASVLFGC